MPFNSFNSIAKLPKKTGGVPGLWVAAGDSGVIANSTNGNTWTAAATVAGVSGKGGISYAGSGVAYGKDNLGAGLWVAVGDGGIIAKSTDGNTWTAAATKGGITYGYGVAYGKDASGAGLWVVVGGNGSQAWIAKSTDGNTWTAAASTGDINYYGMGVAYGKDNLGAGLWVAVGGGGVIAKSTNGNNWTATSTGGITGSGYVFRVAYGKDGAGAGLWVAVGNGGSLIAKSTDGNTWTAAATKGGLVTGRDVAFNRILSE